MSTTETALDLVLTKALYNVPEARHLLSLGRSTFYELVRAGRIRTVKEGRTRLVPAAAIAEYVRLLEREADARSREDAG